MDSLENLARHLDARAAAARPLSLWWRDDDLEAASPELAAFLEAMADVGIVPALAAIPARLSPSAIEALNGTDARVFVHGWRHTNHADPAAKKSEFGPDRPIAARLDEIARGCERVRQVAGARAVACFVPPWNRIADDLLPRLGEVGITALSAFGSPRGRPPAAAVPRLDTHIDLVDWRGTGRPIGAGAFGDRIRDYDGVDGPVGILSHHRVTGLGAWADWRSVLELLTTHPGVRWLVPTDALAGAGVGTGVGPSDRRDG